MTGPFERERDLGTVLEELRDDVDDLLDAVRGLPERVAGVDGRIEQLDRMASEVARRTREAEVGVRDLTATVKRLDARVEWLERNIRLHDPVGIEVELDDVPADLVELAAIAERGQSAQLSLLPAATRARLEAAVEAHAQAVRLRSRLLDEALAASRTIAVTSMGDDVHAEAVDEFREVHAGYLRARRRCRDLARDAVDAADELARDERRRAERADVIAAGEAAWRELLGRLRARVAEAVGAGALLPAWFTGVLGPIPPAEDTKDWMDAATALLAYRVSYGITDPVLALGGPPEDRDGARRRAWYQQLSRRLRDLQH